MSTMSRRFLCTQLLNQLIKFSLGWLVEILLLSVVLKEHPRRTALCVSP